jgi:hypothetical protein
MHSGEAKLTQKVMKIVKMRIAGGQAVLDE